VAHFLVFQLEAFPSAKQIDGAMLCGPHEPGTRLVGDARRGPLFERGNQRVLRQLLREPDVANDPRETGDQPGGLDPPDRLDGTLGI
jgi:hypothetical protein